MEAPRDTRLRVEEGQAGRDHVGRKGRWLVQTVTVPKDLSSSSGRTSAQTLPWFPSFYLDMNDLVLKL